MLVKIEKKNNNISILVDTLNNCNYCIDIDTFFDLINVKNLKKNPARYKNHFNQINNKKVNCNKQLTKKELVDTVIPLLTNSEQSIYIYCHHFDGCDRQFLLQYFNKDTLRLTLQSLKDKCLITLQNDKYIVNPIMVRAERGKYNGVQQYSNKPVIYKTDGTQISFTKKEIKNEEWIIDNNLIDTLKLYYDTFDVSVKAISNKDINKEENMNNINYRYTGNQGYTMFRPVNMMYKSNILYIDMYDCSKDVIVRNKKGEPYKTRNICDINVINRFCHIVAQTVGLYFTDIQSVVDYVNNHHVNMVYRSKDDNMFYQTDKKPNNYVHVFKVEEKEKELTKKEETRKRLIDLKKFLEEDGTITVNTKYIK